MKLPEHFPPDDPRECSARLNLPPNWVLKFLKNKFLWAGKNTKFTSRGIFKSYFLIRRFNVMCDVKEYYLRPTGK